MKKRLSFPIVVLALSVLFSTIMAVGVWATDLGQTDNEVIGKAASEGSEIASALDAYDSLFVGSDGSKTEAGGTLVGLFTAYGDAASYDRVTGCWYNKVNPELNANVFGPNWVVLDSGGLSLDYTAETFDNSTLTDGVTLPNSFADLDDFYVDAVGSYRLVDAEKVVYSPRSSSFRMDLMASFFHSNPSFPKVNLRIYLSNRAWTTFNGMARPNVAYAFDGYGGNNEYIGNGLYLEPNKIYTQTFVKQTTSTDVLVKMTIDGELQSWGCQRNGVSTIIYSEGSLSKEDYAATKASTIGNSNLSAPFSIMNGTPGTLYAVRVYTAPLTEAEVGQNKLADLIAYYRIDLNYYKRLSEAGQDEIHVDLLNIGFTEDVETVKQEIDQKMRKMSRYSYSISDGSATIIGIDGAFLGDIAIPESIDGYPVVAIAKEVFSGCTGITSVAIPANVNVIGEDAFLNCTSIKQVYYRGTESEWNTIVFDNVAASPLAYGATLISNAREFVFFDEGGATVLKRGMASVGTPITAPNVETRLDAQYSLRRVFADFFDGMLLVDDVVFVAKCEKILNQYTYTFLDEDGTVLKQTTVDYGTVIVAPSIDPTKAADVAYTYTFASYGGYTDGMAVTGDATFTAQYDAILNKYTYTFVNEDGTILKQTTAEYGTAIVTPTEKPIKPATVKYSYTFAGFEGYTNGMVVTGDVTFTAKYDATINQYTYVFLDEDGTTVLETATANYGSSIPAPSTPPTKSATAQYTYTFAGYERYTSGMTLTGDITFRATYSSTVNKYTYTFYDEDGITVLKTATVNYGSSILVPSTLPTKPSTVKYSYTFASFAGYTSGMTVTGNIAFTAQYAATVNKYTYTFFDEDGATVLKQFTADYGTVITAPTAPAKQGNAQYSYPFAGFENFSEGMTITGDATFIAKYETVVNQYTYTFYDEDGVTILKQEKVDYGSVIVAPTVEEFRDTVYTYSPYFPRFVEGMAVEKDVSFTLNYIESKNKYAYIFFDEDGSVLKEVIADYGTVIVAPTVLSKANTAQYTYTFVGFEGYAYGMTLTANVTFTAKYTATVNQYTYTFVDEDGTTVLGTATVDYGTVIIAPADPTKADDALYNYSFKEWQGYQGGMKITSDSIFTAVYTTEIKLYGDVDMDGTVNALDVLMIKQHIVAMITLDETALMLADVDMDGTVNALDALVLQQYIVGMDVTIGAPKSESMQKSAPAPRTATEPAAVAEHKATTAPTATLAAPPVASTPSQTVVMLAMPKRYALCAEKFGA